MSNEKTKSNIDSLNKPTEIKNEKKLTVFSKNAFLKSGKYKKDIINAVLEDSKKYTESEAISKIDEYLKGRVI